MTSSAAIIFKSLGFGCSLMSLMVLMQNRTWTLLQDFCHLKTLLIYKLVLSVFTLPRQCPQTILVDFFWCATLSLCALIWNWLQPRGFLLLLLTLAVLSSFDSYGRDYTLRRWSEPVVFLCSTHLHILAELQFISALSSFIFPADGTEVSEAAQKQPPPWPFTGLRCPLIW